MATPIRHPALSASLDLEHVPPDISTPVYVPNLVPSRTRSQMPHTHDQSQASSLPQSLDMDLVSPVLEKSSKSSWEDQKEPLEGLSTREGVSIDAVQCELPLVLPTPGRELGRLTDQAHDHLDKFQQKQEKVLNELAKQVQRSRFHLESKLNKLTGQTEQSLRNLHTFVSASKEKFDHEMDTIMKANKTVISSEVDQAKATIVSDLGFMIKQMQIEFQDELQVTQKMFDKKNFELIKCVGDCTSMLKILSTKVDDVSEKVNSIAATHKREIEAFLAEDYKDELAERVRTKKQGENESIRDFAYSYRALCTRWNPELTELDIVKLIVKHIKPYLASQLRGRVNDVDELVRLGHQLERDHDQQLEYEQKDDLPLTADLIWEEQHKDPEIEKLFKAVAEGEKEAEEKYTVLEDKLYRKKQVNGTQNHYRIYIPSSLTFQMFEAYHKNPLSGHLGIFKTYKRLHAVAFWPGMWSDVKKLTKSCEKCEVLKYDNKKPAGKMQQNIVNNPNEMLGVDIMGPFPRSSQQNEYVLVTVDYHTRWVEIFPMRAATSQTIARILRAEIFTRWGVPTYILSDRGSQFISAVFQELCRQWAITQKLTTAYHPQTNMTERVNRTLKCMMASYVEENHKKWDLYLPEFRFALNSAVQETIGLTPAELHIGRKLQSPMDKILQADITVHPDTVPYETVHRLKRFQENAEICSKKARLRQLRNYNKNRREVSYKFQDRVWVRNFPQSSALHHFTAKLAKKWKGPYRIVRKLGPVNYQVVIESTGEDVRNVHVCNLKPCYPTAEDLERKEKQNLLDLFLESSDEDDFPGFDANHGLTSQGGKSV
ncbi:hyaluronan mediated motility receptor-like [Pseudorasbora parva]|uniref:hyaluronan mediated motility receptor-like n=1 Tax=Pseudorasbora parva TaxID=51549 RepID=UPI00351DE7C5